MKTCGICKEALPVESFTLLKTGFRYSYCKPCANKKSREQKRTAKPEQKRDWRLRFYFGLTTEQYNELLRSQNGVCAICEEPPTENKPLCVDHDHSCCEGKKSCGDCIRGLLCLGCNTGLGAFKDDTDRIERSLLYVKASQRQVVA